MMVSPFKKKLVAATIPFAHIFAGLAGGTMAMNTVEPSETVRITALNVEMTSSMGNGVELLGEDIASTFGFHERIAVELIDKKDYPKAIEESVKIFDPPKTKNIPNDKKTTPIDRLKDTYADDIEDALRRIAIKNILVFATGAMAGSMLLQAGIWHYRHRREQGNSRVAFIKRAGIPFGVALIASSGVNLYNANSLTNDNQLLSHAENVISSPIDDYLLTSTSSMAVNLNTITEQISIDLHRLSAIEQALQKGSQEVKDTPTNVKKFLIVSDSHNLPTAPQTIQDLLDATGADGLIDLGDFIDVGLQPEIDALNGLTIGDVSFIGYGDIRRCLDFDSNGKCENRGDQYDKYALTGNHDPSHLMTTLKALGFKDLSQQSAAGIGNVYSMSDSCPQDIANTTNNEDLAKQCRDDYHSANAIQAKEKLDQLRNSIKPDQTKNTPDIGFFASRDAAKQFIGEIPFIVYGGDHEFSSNEENGTRIIGISSIGQGGARDAKYAGATLLTISQNREGKISVQDCKDMRFDVTSAGRESIQPCFR